MDWPQSFAVVGSAIGTVGIIGGVVVQIFKPPAKRNGTQTEKLLPCEAHKVRLDSQEQMVKSIDDKLDGIMERIATNEKKEDSSKSELHRRIDDIFKLLLEIKSSKAGKG